MEKTRIPLACALVSAAAFALSVRFGGLWWLGWVAPVPVLWLAFRRSHPMVALAAALVAGALAGLGQMAPYAGVVSLAALAASAALAGIGLGVCVMLARFASRSVAPLAGAIVFAALWTLWDFIAASGPDGALVSPAYAQASAPIVVQTAAIYGGWAVTFLIGLTAGLTALAFARRHSFYLLAAALLFTLNLGFGVLHMHEHEGPERRVVLIANNGLAEASAVDRKDIALGAVLAYAAQVRLSAEGADLVVLPERIAILRPEWRPEAVDILGAAAADSGATIVAGFEARGDGATRNVALTITPHGEALPPYVQSSGAGINTGGVAVAISHDMNFFAGLRARSRDEHAGILAIPAWDFGTDGSVQAREAILRGVESGFAVARSARNGELVLADALGRTVAAKKTRSDGFTVLSGDLAAGTSAGSTVYDRIGDTFVWFAALLGLSLVLGGALRLLTGDAPGRDMRGRAFPVPAWGLRFLSAPEGSHARRRFWSSRSSSGRS